jgi:hypothetical protein
VHAIGVEDPGSVGCPGGRRHTSGVRR